MLENIKLNKYFDLLNKMTSIKQALNDIAANSITSLDLSLIEISDECVSVLAHAISKNTSLTSLDLGGNYIRDEGASAFADVLLNNTSLTSLDLQDTDIDNKGAIALAHAMSKNTSLTSLDLSSNYISDRGARALAYMLIQNTSLTSMDFDSYFDTNDNTYDNTITALLKRNNNYVKCKLSMEMFFSMSDIPNELNYIVNSCVLPLCLD